MDSVRVPTVHIDHPICRVIHLLIVNFIIIIHSVLNTYRYLPRYTFITEIITVFHARTVYYTSYKAITKTL